MIFKNICVFKPIFFKLALLVGVITCNLVTCKTRPKADLVLQVSHQAEMILDDKFDFTSYSHKDFKITRHQIKAKSLKLFIELNHACGAHHFRLITTSALLKSLPPQKSVFLINDNHNKVDCGRKTEIELEFDLGVLESVPYETIVLNIEGYESPIVYHNKKIQK